ncbi:MAG: hypothetical protein QOF61_3280, partial [Acidobacteriota bacterium]|nr:hypothetical protein [Acidobacteriota bacterium]
AITINGDTAFEPNETVNLSLSNAQGGASLGSPASATLTITNDDTAAPAATVYVDDNWVGTTPGTDPDGAGPATNFGYDAFDTIQGGVNGVAANGTVNVAAGTYSEQPVVGKSLTLLGAGAGATNITAPATLATRFNNFYILFEVNGGASVEASGITVRGPMNLNGCRQATPFSTFRRYYGVYVRGGATLNLHDSSVTDIRENSPAANTNCQLGTAIDAGTSVAGLNQTGALTLTNTTVTGFQARGVTVDFAGSSATITNNTLTGSTSTSFSQTVILVAIGASAQISGNQITGAQCSDAVNCGSDTFNQAAAVGVSLTAPANGTQVSNNTISNNDYGINSVTAPNVTPVISGNTFDSNRYFGVNISDGNATITGNTFSGTSNVAVVAASVNDPANATSADTAVTFTSNTITGATVGLQLLDDPNFPADGFFPRITAHFNRIVAATAIDNPQNSVTDMENNWWGCNAGPGNTGCGTVNGTGADFNPWLVLSVNASPNTIVPGGTSTITADLLHNSANVVPSNTTFVPPTPVSFAATQGNVSPNVGTITNGQATTTFTSTSASSGTASATVDNQTTSANVNVTAPSFSIDDVTHNEGNSGTTSYTFTVTKTGTTAFSSSVDYATVDGTATAPSDYTAIPTTTLNFASNETTKQFTVLVNGDTSVEPDEAFTVHLSNAVGASISDADSTGTITNDDVVRPAPNVVYVDDDFTGPDGADPDGAGPATEKGYDAFRKIQEGVSAVAAGGTVNVYAGTYNEDVAISNAGLSLVGIGAGTKTVLGAIGGDGATIHVLASNVTVAGLTITRAGNNTTDWNNPGLNNAGFAIQGQAITGALIRDNIITGNRTGIDINNSGGHTVRNNVIDDNRTGMIFRNQTDQMTVVENFITNNWTVGVLFLDGSGGTNSPAQSALHSTFSNNNISANWYGQIVDRQSGGSLPAPGTTNLKNFRGDWFGTTSPVVTTANSSEPGYAAQIPVEFGGSATPPGGQPDIAGPASANFKYTPFLLSGTDTNIETTPGRGTFGFQGVQNTVVVSPANQNGWVFFDDNPGVGTGSGGFEEGPATPPLGIGSAFLTVDSQGRHALGTAAYAGTRMDDITGLSYYSYQDNNANTVVAISLQFDIDYDLNDTSNTFQGRLVFEPYQSGGTVQQNVWQNWDARAGNWYGTRTTVTVNNVAGVAQPCQQATPCTWQQVLTLFPNAGVRNTPTSVVLFKAGGPWSPGFRGNVDDFRITVNTAQTTYDFEPPPPSLSIDDVTHNEGNSGTTDYTFTVTLSRASNQTVTVDYATADDSATAPSDYTAIPTTTLTFAPGETTKQVTVQANGDTTFEPGEQFFVNLSNPSNATIADAQGVGTIQNDDAAPAFSISDVTLAEGNTGLTNFVFHVTKTGTTSQSASVQFATADGTATTAGSDYDSNSGTLTFAPAETDKTVTVAVHGDTVYEANETFFVNLSAPTSATITDNQGVGTITNDDQPPATLVVNTTDDNNDGFCLADHCSLREAINASNANVDINTINFAIPATDAGRNATTGVYTITPASPLPTASRRVTIDGYSQTPCSSNPAPCSKPNTLAVGDDAVLLIELNGTGAGAGINGLNITAGNSTVSGLIINRFSGHGIALQINNTNAITGNFIGTDAAGSAALGNAGSGVALTSSFNTVGGTTAAARNIISANGASGVRLAGSNTVQGNYIGTDASGASDLGNAGNGIASTGFTLTIGGTTPGAGNLISGNDGDGVSLVGGNSIVVQGNLIGTKADGTSALGNGANGVSFSGGGSVFNTVGGVATGEANTIAFNGGDGIQIDATASFAHTLRGNSIYSNGTTPAHLGIDLGGDGVTPNDPKDPDSGANNLQNFPVISAAVITGSTKTISGTLNSTPGQTFNIDFYTNDACDASGNGEGKTYLGSLTTGTTDSNGDVSFTFHPSVLTSGQFITATATNAGGSTSEFSACAAVGSGTAGTIQFSSSSYTVLETGGTAAITITRVGGSDGSISADFSTTDGTATAPADYTTVPSQTVTFTDGDTTPKTINVSINNDNIYEGNETVNLSLSATTVNLVGKATPHAAFAPVTSATLTIQDDEAVPSFSINDVIVSEPQSGTSNATFTVTLSNATQAPVSVTYATADGTATAPADYTAVPPTQLNFASGETTKTVSVSVNADGFAEGNETFTVNLSNPSPPLTILDGTGLGTITDAVSAGQVIISEFRFHGANGAQDEFVELYNNSNSDVTVATDDGTPGWALAAIMPDGTTVDLLATIPAGTVIPARSHYLIADSPAISPSSGYSLSVASDLTYDCDIDDGAGVALFRTAEPTSFSNATRLDAAGFSTLTTPQADLFREGAGLTSPGNVDGEYSYVRNLVTGLPKDTNNNSADFVFVSTNGGVYGGVPSVLGAPGPENAGSPLQRTSTVKATFIDPSCTVTSSTPGDACARYRDTTADDANNSHFGTLGVRRRFTNNTGANVTQLRFRIVDITTRAGGAEPPVGTADLRVRTSQNFTATKTGGGTVNIKGLTLEQPPSQAIGGGLNSTLAAGTITLATPLVPGNSINVEFLVGVQQQGSFRFFVTVEAVLDGATTGSPSKQGSVKATSPVRIK